MHKEKLFEVVKVRFEKKVFAVRKKWKTNIWNLHLSEKMTIFFLQNMPACGKRSNFFLIITKKCARRSYLSVWESNSKSNSLNYKKWKKLRFEVLFFVKKLIFFIQKKYARAIGGTFFTGLYVLIDAQKKVLKIGKN